MTSNEHNSGRLQPNSHNCFACGLENPIGLALRVFTVAPGQVEARHQLDRRYEGYPGMAHGGIVAALLDEVVARTAMTQDPDHFMVTAKLDLRFRHPVPIDTPLTLRGNLVSDRGSRATARAELLLEDGTLAAEADAMLSEYPQLADRSESLRDLGWRVYPLQTHKDG